MYEMCSMNKAFLSQHLVVKLQEKDREVHQLAILLDTEKVLWWSLMLFTVNTALSGARAKTCLTETQNRICICQ